MIWETLDENLIMLDLDVKSSDELFEIMGNRLIKKGYCKETYVEALKTREHDYPTGVDLDGINFAMPHTDRTHVNESTVAIGVLKNPVHFYHMGTNDQDVWVKLVFMLAIKDPNAHIDMLGRLLKLFSDPDMLEKVTKANTEQEIVHIFKEKDMMLDKEAS